jgi:hypothetical protein
VFTRLWWLLSSNQLGEQGLGLHQGDHGCLLHRSPQTREALPRLRNPPCHARSQCCSWSLGKIRIRQSQSTPPMCLFRNSKSLQSNRKILFVLVLRLTTPRFWWSTRHGRMFHRLYPRSRPSTWTSYWPLFRFTCYTTRLQCISLHLFSVPAALYHCMWANSTPSSILGVIFSRIFRVSLGFAVAWFCRRLGHVLPAF